MVLFLVSACAPKDNGNGNNNGTDEPETPNVETPGEETPGQEETPENDKTSYYHSDYSVKLDAIEVYDKFLKDYDGVQLTEFELSLKRQGYVYQLEGMTSEEEIEADYDASNGDLVELEKDTYNPDKEKLAKEDLNQLNDFLDLAFKDSGDNYYLKELTLKIKNGVKLVEVEIIDESGHEIEYKYDFASKELLEKD